MKKITFLLLSCILACALLVGCNKKTEDEAPTPCLTCDMTLTLEDNVLSGKQETTFTNVYSEGLSSALFHLYANAYKEDAKYKAYSGILPSYGGIEVTAATVNGSPVQATVDETDQYLSVPLPSPALGEKVTVSFEYTVTIPQGLLRFGKNGNSYFLSGFYPQLAAYSNGAFLADPFTTVGDPFFNEIGSYSVSLTCPSSLVVASGIKQLDNKDCGETCCYRFEGKNVRDLAFAASPDFTVKSDNVKGCELQLFTLENSTAENHFSAFCSAYSVFTDAFGSCDKEVCSLVVAPFDFSGMEFSGIVFVSTFSGDETTDVILHETAHQWWYDLVGSDPIRQSALDEGLTSFTAVYYYLLSGNEKEFSDRIAEIKKVYTRYETLQTRRKTGIEMRLDKTIYDYTSYQYTMLAYYKACMLFNNLYELYGKEKFNACLRSYAEAYAHKVASFDNFIEVCNRTLKTDVSGLVNGWLGDNSTATTFAAE